MRRMWFAVLVVAGAVPGAGCGGSSDNEFVVAADPALKSALVTYGGGFKEAEAKFAILDPGALAKRMRGGDRTDVVASPDLKLLRALNAEGVIGRPALFAYRLQQGKGVEYAIAVVRRTTAPDAAKAFIYGLLVGDNLIGFGRADLTVGVAPKCGPASVTRARCPKDLLIAPAPVDYGP